MSRAYDLLWKARRHATRTGDVGCLRSLVPGAHVDEPQVEELLRELADSPELAAGLAGEDARRWFDGPQSLREQLDLEGHGRGRAILLYAALRLVRPSVVIETGCFTGWDSAVMLQALERNGHGRLVTIDLPAQEGLFSQLPGRRSALLPGMAPGFLVPDALQDRWTLLLGDVRDELPAVLEEVDGVDVFFHDSDHTYEHMVWEYASAWPRLAPGGLLLSDDISWNTSFWDFARATGSGLVIHRATPNVGGIRVAGARVGHDPKASRAREAVGS